MPFNIDEKYIIETEKQLSLTFPQSFRNKMMNENGGSPELSFKCHTSHHKRNTKLEFEFNGIFYLIANSCITNDINHDIQQKTRTSARRRVLFRSIFSKARWAMKRQRTTTTTTTTMPDSRTPTPTRKLQQPVFAGAPDGVVGSPKRESECCH